MSTCNFEPMKYDMPLIVGCMEDYDDMKESYEDCNDEEYTYDMYDFDLQLDFDDMDQLAKDFSKDLKYHVVEAKDGYYQGAQFVVYETYSDGSVCEYEDIEDFDNDDAHYWYDMCRSRLLREVEREQNKIKKFLLSLKDQGYMELSCMGVFSNGEAVYTKVN